MRHSSLLTLAGLTVTGVLILLVPRVLDDESTAEPPTARAARTGAATASLSLRLQDDVRFVDDAARARIARNGPAQDLDVTRQDETEARTMQGRVAIPADAPADETLAVVVLGAARAPETPDAPLDLEGDRSWHHHEVLARTVVDPDGSFRVNLPEQTNTDELHVDLDGRHLYLHEPVAMNHAPLVLEPELGGAIRGTMVLPGESGEVPGRVHAGTYGMHYSGGGMTRDLVIHDTTVFELRALQPGLRYAVWVNADVYPGALHEGELQVEAGQTTEVSIALQEGATVRGLVVSEDGEPMADVEVTGNGGNAYSMNPDSGTTRTDDEGHFELRGMVPGLQLVTARKAEHLDSTSDELTLEDGQVLEDVRIVLQTGVALRGTVRWPDGEAAVAARLSIVPLELQGQGWHVYDKARDPAGWTGTGPDGRFEARGLVPGTYALYAWLDRDEDEGLQGGTTWTARVASVEAGGDEVHLILREPVALQGRVINDIGAPVQEFTVTALRNDWPTWMNGPSRSVEQTFTAANGQFRLEGLDDGDWTLSIHDEGHLRSDDRSCKAPGAIDAPFELTRTATVTGVLLDPTGAPVPDAEVTANADTYEAKNAVVRTDSNGRFNLSSVGPGSIRIGAESEDWAPAPDQRIKLEPGETRADFTLRLTNGGAIAGLVYAKTGGPAAQRMIVVQSETGDAYETRADDAGRFRVEHLAPGAYQVIAPPDPETESSDDHDLGDMFGSLLITMAHVEEGSTVEVVLGAPPRAPVRVHGRVLRDGQPVANANVMAFAEGGSLLENMRADTSEEDGRFELQLDEPGNYTFVVMNDRLQMSEVDFQMTIPEVADHNLDLVVPGGSITGRMLAPNGSPVDGGVVWLRREDGTSPLSTFTGRTAIDVDEDGSFQIDSLHDGVYAISGTDGENGLCTTHEVTVRTNDAAPHVELQLRSAGHIRGVVRDATGQPVEDALVYLRDADGATLYRLTATTDYQGEFRIDRVPAGEISVFARTEEQVSATPVLVHLDAGAEGIAELTLQSGVFLSVDLVDADTSTPRANVRVVNETGEVHVQSLSHEELERYLRDDRWLTERRVGPLAPGRYTISATTPEGRTASETVELNDTSEMQVLRLEIAP